MGSQDPLSPQEQLRIEALEHALDEWRHGRTSFEGWDVSVGRVHSDDSALNLIQGANVLRITALYKPLKVFSAAAAVFLASKEARYVNGHDLVVGEPAVYDSAPSYSVLSDSLRQLAGVEHLVKQTMDGWGRVDILVANAGITRDGVFHRMNSEQWSEVIRVNMDSLFNMTRNVIEGMRARRYGRIVNVASTAGLA